MIRRRDVLLGGGLLLGAGAALAMTPRERLILMGDRKLETMLPKRFGPWRDVPSSAVLLPDEPGSLTARLYRQVLSRLYEAPGRLPIMLVIAYGDTQSDLLQVHRPEVCYAAVGFQIEASRRIDLEVGGRARVPARELVARSDQRVEPLVYWTRVGDDLPTSRREQQLMKLRTELGGVLPDGVLVRISTIAEPAPAVFAQLQAFARDMISALKPADRPVLIGRPLAAATLGSSAAA